MMRRNRSSAPGAPLVAIAPMSHSTGRRASMSVVAISSSRPLRYSAPMRARKSSSTFCPISVQSGCVSAIASLLIAANTGRVRKMSACRVSV